MNPTVRLIIVIAVAVIIGIVAAQLIMSCEVETDDDASAAATPTVIYQAPYGTVDRIKPLVDVIDATPAPMPKIDLLERATRMPSTGSSIR